MTQVRTVLLIVAVLATAFSGCISSEPAEGHEAVLDAAREASLPLRDAKDAWDAGYRPMGPCVPGMGVHWFDLEAVDRNLDPEHPEALLFQPTTSNRTNPAAQRFVGVEYLVVTEDTRQNATNNLPTLLGVELDGPIPGHQEGMPWHADLHVYLGGEIRSPPSFPSTRSSITCPSGTEVDTGPNIEEQTPPRELPGCDTLNGTTTHEHAEVRLFLNSSKPYDLSHDRYQLQARFVHVEGGARDANGATVHVHEVRPTLGCFLATLGFEVSEDRIVTDQDRVFAEDARQGIQILVDGSVAETGFETPLQHGATYEVRYTTADPGPA